MADQANISTPPVSIRFIVLIVIFCAIPLFLTKIMLFCNEHVVFILNIPYSYIVPAVL